VNVHELAGIASIVLSVALVGTLAELWRYWRKNRRRSWPYDWAKEDPDMRLPKAAHVSRLGPRGVHRKDGEP
jgi:hypothetical protein